MHRRTTTYRSTLVAACDQRGLLLGISKKVLRCFCPQWSRFAFANTDTKGGITPLNSKSHSLSSPWLWLESRGHPLRARHFAGVIDHGMR